MFIFLVSVASRAADLIDRKMRDHNATKREKLVQRMNEQTRDAVLSCIKKIADVCGGIKHTYDSLNSVVFKEDGCIRGLEMPALADVEGSLRAFKQNVSFTSAVTATQKSVTSLSPVNKTEKESDQKKKFLSPNKKSSILDSFDKIIVDDIVAHVRHPEKNLSEVKSKSPKLEPPLSNTPVDALDYYESDFETSLSPEKKSQNNRIINASLPARLISPKPKALLQADTGYACEEECEEITTKPIKLRTSEAPVDDVNALFEALGIDPDSLVENVVASDDLRFPKALKIQPKQKKMRQNFTHDAPLKAIKLQEDEKQKCSECSKNFSGDGKTIPNLKNLDQPAVEIVAKMLADNADPSRKKKVIDEDASDIKKSSKLFCSWRCAKNWNKRNTPLQLRYHTDVMIDFASAVETSR